MYIAVELKYKEIALILLDNGGEIEAPQQQQRGSVQEVQIEDFDDFGK
jgi:hypothetical protein